MRLIAPAELRPAPGPAHDWVREELAKREYQPTLLERVTDWLWGRLDDVFTAVQRVGALNPAVALALLVLLLLGLTLVLARLRGEPRNREPVRAVHGDSRATAAEHRDRARRALAQERWDDAVVEGVRALATGLVERDLVEDLPAATAREVAVAAAAVFASQASRLGAAARLFEDVRYGGRHATRTAATELLDLEQDLAHRRPEEAGAPTAGLVVPR